MNKLKKVQLVENKLKQTQKELRQSQFSFMEIKTKKLQD
jgi:hypothetical protein